ncbi:MAG: diacylglycerol kinase family protein [Pseudomonadota bacterium]
MTPLVAILSNPGSTTNRRSIDKVRALVQASSHVLHVEVKRFEEIPEALRLMARAQPAVLVINGGDGTIQASLSALINHAPFGERPPPVAVLPGGKTNMIARDLGMRSSTVAELRRLLALVAAGGLAARRARYPLIGLDRGDGGPVAYGMFFGAAGIVGGIDACRGKIYPLGLPNLLSHALTMALIFFNVLARGNVSHSLVRAAPMRINLKGGGILDGAFFIVMATTLSRLVMGLDPFMRQGKGSLKFTAIEYRRATIWRALLALLLGRFGRSMISGVHFRTVDAVRIMSTQAVTLDGEMFAPQPGQAMLLDGTKSLDFVKL